MSVYVERSPVIASVDVDSAVLATLEMWMNDALNLFEDAHSLGRSFFARPKSFDSVIDETQFLDHKLPGILATAAKVDGAPDVMHDGSYSADWLVAVSAVVRGRTARDAKYLASVLEAVSRHVLVSKPDLMGFAQGLRWHGGGEVRPLPDQRRENRWLAEGASQYIVRVDNNVRHSVFPVTSGDGGITPSPSDSPDTIYLDLPVPAVTVDEDVQADSIPTGGSP